MLGQSQDTEGSRNNAQRSPANSRNRAQSSLIPISPPIPPTPSVHPDQPTGVSLAESYLFPHYTHRFSLRLRAYHFFASTTFSASRSSACCATIFFSRPFSSSN